MYKDKSQLYPEKMEMFVPPPLCSFFPVTKSVSIIFSKLSVLSFAKRYQENVPPQVF